MSHLTTRNIRSLLTLTAALAAGSLFAFDARYSPSELNVSWPTPEDEMDKAALIFSHPIIGDANIMTGVVQVGADAERPFLARLDDSGNIVWSKRMPFSMDEFSDNFSLIDDANLLVSYQEASDPMNPSEDTLDRVASFNPQNGFSARYALSMPGLEQDPLDPFSGGRDFQAQRDSKVAIVETEGTDIKVMLLDETGTPVFSKAYALPAGGGGLPFPIPGFGLSYSFATLTELENGEFYLTTSGADLLAQTVKVVALRLNSSGEILWQRVIDMPGTTAFVFPRLDEKILISGNRFTEEGTVSSPIALLDENGQLAFATSVQGVLMNAFSFSHFEATDNILLQGNLNIPSGPEDFLSDGAILILSNTGEKVAEAAYDMGDFDSLFHIGTVGDSIYFELFGIEDETGDLTHGILVKADATLENWTARSYLDVVGASGNFSSFFAGVGSPYISYRDAPQNWISVSKLDANLQEIGECEVLADTTVVPYDPNLTLASFSPTIASSGVTVSDWAGPALTNDPFSLEDTPLTVEFVCGNTGGGGDGILTAGEWTETDFGWVFGLTEDWGISTYLSYVYVAGFPYVYQVNLGWMYLVSNNGNDHYFYTWDNGWILINEGFGGYYYIYATDDYTQQIPQP